MDTKKKTDRSKLIADVSKKLKEIDNIQEAEDLVKNNTIEFFVDDKSYRVKKPNRRDRHEIRYAKNKKKNELLADPKNVTEEELVQMYYNRNTPVDIPKMRQNLKSIQHKIDQKAIRLTESLSETDKKQLELQIEELHNEKLNLIYKIQELLETSIEQQLKEYVQEYLIYMCLEQNIDNEWKRVYSSYDDFMDADSEFDDKLLIRAAHFLSLLIYWEP